MKQWILGREYDFTNDKDKKDLLNLIDVSQINSVRQIAYGLMGVVEASANKLTTV